MWRRCGTAISDHENRGGEREAKSGEAKDEDEGVEAAELLYGDGGMEVRSWRWSVDIATGLAVTECLRGSHGGGQGGNRSLL